jgi:beta-glucosidase
MLTTSAPSGSLSETVESILADLTLEEKVALCHAGSKFGTNGVERAGITPLIMSDGPHGVRQEFEEHSWKPRDVEWDIATYLPTGAALAATWNPALARTFGETLGAEARARGKDVLLGPGFNIVRDPRCGRNFEYLGEDPCLIRALVPEIIQGIQEQDVAACAKHFAMNNQEWNRGKVDARPDERTFREIYAPGFEAAVEAGVWMVMGAYNKFHGQWCCENDRLLKDILKEQWAFQGAVVSDWCAVHDARDVALGGLDIEMGTSDDYAKFLLADSFLAMLRSGEVPEDVLDDKVRRILRVHFWTGKLDGRKRKAGRGPCVGHTRVARKIAEEAVVLLKNDGLLPLDPGAIRTVAVIGENAVTRHALGGGSSGVKSPYEVTPLEGIRDLLGASAKVLFARGYPDEGMPYAAVPAENLEVVDAGAGVRGWQVTWKNADWISRVPPVSEFRESVDFSLPSGTVPVPGFHLEGWSGIFKAILRAPESGLFVFALRGDSDALLYVDGVRRIELRQNHHRSICTAVLELQKGQTCEIEIRYEHGAGDALLQFGWQRPGQPPVVLHSSLREEALQAARESDVVLFFGGLNHSYDNEGGDRAHLSLPGGQDDLIRELVKVNPRTVVTMIAGAAVEMPWANDVPALLYGWYAGMEAGRAFANILFGRTNPSGKLPFTIPHCLTDTPAVRLDDYNGETCDYREGIFTGYRWYDHTGIEPLYPFGHGLGYSAFSIMNLKVEEIENGRALCLVSCRLGNLGRRTGRETVQVYVGHLNSPVPRPRRELKAFRKVSLEPGKSVHIEFLLTKRDFSYWDETIHAWKLDGGEYEIGVGVSSRDIRASEAFRLCSK